MTRVVGVDHFVENRDDVLPVQAVNVDRLAQLVVAGKTLLLDFIKFFFSLF